VSFSPTQALAAGDVNGDGLADLFVANAAASSGPGVRAGCKVTSTSLYKDLSHCV